MLGKKAQIGETLTWVVATIIIIVILGASIFIVSASKNSRSVSFYNSNDIILTKSAMSFFSYQGNFDNLKNSINNNDFNSFNSKAILFSEKISVRNMRDFRVFADGKLIGDSVINNNFHGLANNNRANLEFNFDGKEISVKIEDEK